MSRDIVFKHNGKEYLASSNLITQLTLGDYGSLVDSSAEKIVLGLMYLYQVSLVRGSNQIDIESFDFDMPVDHRRLLNPALEEIVKVLEDKKLKKTLC